MTELKYINKNGDLFKSKKYNNSNEKITEGRLSYSRSFSYTNHININSIYNQSLFSNNPKKEIKLGQFIFEKKIGEGTFGKVILAKDEITKEKVAIKILEKRKILKETNISKLEREIKILKLLRHNNIVHLYNVIETNNYLYLVMEYIKGIELFDYINQKQLLSEKEACKFYQQIISGIEYLGKVKIVHRDIKPENLIISNNDTIKIVDFGLSNTYFNENLLCTACGSPCYAAPEMIKGEKYSGICIDIWSSGVVLYAMLCGVLPFEDNDNDELYRKISKGKFDIPEFLSDYAKDLIHRILNVDPNKRYNIDQIKSHPWFNQLNPKLYMTEGLLIKNVVVPIDENIVNMMAKKYIFNEQEIKIDLILNEHNEITTIYYLILKKIIREGKKTIGDMRSDIFVKYIHDKKNQLSYYDNDFNLIINERVYGRKEYLKKIKKKNIRQISETKNIKKHYLIDNDAVFNINSRISEKNIRGNSVLITNQKKLDINNDNNNNDNNPNIKNSLKYIVNYSNKKIETKKDNKISVRLWKKIYTKKLLKKKNNSRNNNNFSFYFNKNNRSMNNKVIQKANLSFYKNDNKEKNNSINNIIKNYNLNNKIQENNKDNACKFSFNKKLISMTNKLDIKYRTNSAFKNYINHNNNNISNNQKNNSINSNSMINDNQNQNSISAYSSINYNYNYNKPILFSHRTNRIKKFNNKQIYSNRQTIKVDRMKLDFNISNNNCTKDLSFFLNNKENKTLNINNKNEKIINTTKLLNIKNNNKKGENLTPNINFKLDDLDKFNNNTSELINLEQSNMKYSKEIKNSNPKEEINMCKKIKIQNSPLGKKIRMNNDERLYFRKKFILRNKNFNKDEISQDYVKDFFGTSAQFHKTTKNKTYINNYSGFYKNMDESENKTIEIREYYNMKNSSKKMISKPMNKSLKINIINNFTNFTNSKNDKKEMKQNININMNMNTATKKKLSENFKINIRKKKILIDNTNNNNNLIKTSFQRKNNFISINQNINKNNENMNINNKKDQINNNKISEPINKLKNNNQIFKQPQLCITNINFYNYINNVNPLQKINKDNICPNPKGKLIQELSEKKMNNVNHNIKINLPKTKNYIPFDLNSILLLNKDNDIKKLFIKVLKQKKINYKIKNNNNNDLAFSLTCYKNNIRFEINISVNEENINKKSILINVTKNQGNSNNFRNIINQIINLIK